jgi:hypothetical protein
MGEKRNAHKILVRKLEGQKLLGRPRRRMECNIKVNFREIGWDGAEWINLVQDRGERLAVVTRC